MIDDTFIINHNGKEIKIFHPNVDNILKGGNRMNANKKLAEYLASKGISQTFVANKTGINIKTINAIVNCNRKISADELGNIAKALDVDINIFFKD